MKADSLLYLCIQSVVSSCVWRLQRRKMEIIPGPLASALFQLLLEEHQMAPPQLELFQSSIEEADFRVCGALLDSTWLAYVGEFRHLSVLKLDGCSGVTSPSLHLLSGLEKLHTLQLNHCVKVGDPAVPAIAKLSSLQDLQLTGTSVTATGVSLLSQLTSITCLHLGGIKVNDPTLRLLKVLQHLHHLIIWGAEVTNESWDVVASFSSLVSLDISWTHITTIPTLASLTSLSSAACHIVSAEQSDGSRSPLRELTLAGSQLYGAIMTDLCIHKLRLLDVSASNLKHWKELSGLTELEKLDVSRSSVRDEDMLFVAEGGSKLTWLNLSHTKVGSEGIRALTGSLPLLTWLSLQETRVDDHVFKYLPCFPQLTNVSLKQTRVRGYSKAEPDVEGVDALSSLANLHSLDLAQADVDDDACERIARLRSLRVLRLSGHRLTDACLPTLQGLHHLEILHINDALLTTLRGFKSPRNLTILDVQGCTFLNAADIRLFLYDNQWVTAVHHESLCENPSQIIQKVSQAKGSLQPKCSAAPDLSSRKKDGELIRQEVFRSSIPTASSGGSRCQHISTRSNRHTTVNLSAKFTALKDAENRDLISRLDERRRFSRDGLLNMKYRKCSHIDPILRRKLESLNILQPINV